jgi:acetyltransferase
LQYPTKYIAELSAEGGIRVLIRPIRSEDASEESDFIARLSTESLYYRFFGGRPTPETIEAFCNIDYEKQMALVAELLLRESDGERLRMFVAVGRLIETTNNRGEFALAVADEFQGLGIGSKLAELLIQFAKDRKLTSIYAAILPGNSRMIQMMTKGFGFKKNPLKNSGHRRAVAIDFLMICRNQESELFLHDTCNNSDGSKSIFGDKKSEYSISS